MMHICENCYATCDIDEDENISLCCYASTIEIDEEDLEETAEQIEKYCFTFGEALEKYGNIAFYIAENLVFMKDYEEA